MSGQHKIVRLIVAGADMFTVDPASSKEATRIFMACIPEKSARDANVMAKQWLSWIPYKVGLGRLH